MEHTPEVFTVLSDKVQYVDISLRDWYKSRLNQAEVPNF